MRWDYSLAIPMVAGFANYLLGVGIGLWIGAQRWRRVSSDKPEPIDDDFAGGR